MNSHLFMSNNLLFFISIFMTNCFLLFVSLFKLVNTNLPREQNTLPTLLHMNNSNIFINILILSVLISFLSFRTFYPWLGFYIFFHIFPFFSLLFLSFPLSFSSSPSFFPLCCFFFSSSFLSGGPKKFLGPLVPWSAIFSCPAVDEHTICALKEGQVA